MHECLDGIDWHRLFQADERRTDDPAAGVQQILHVEAPHKSRDAGQAQMLIICPASHRRNAAAAGRENVHHWFLCKPALGGRRSSTAMPIRASFCRRTGACRSLSQPFFRISRNQGVTHTTLQAKSCAKGVLPLACRLGQVLQNVLHFEVATGDPHPFGNPRETHINCAAHTRPVR